jgi:hypothetical protein
MRRGNFALNLYDVNLGEHLLLFVAKTRQPAGNRVLVLLSLKAGYRPGKSRNWIGRWS